MSKERALGARAEASRRNGAKSRGPKTRAGKLASARNALKHGLRARKFVLLAGEDRAAFRDFEAALVAELAPEGVLQSLIAARVANAAWRMDRADRMEADLLDRQSDHRDGAGGGQALGIALIRDGHGPRAFEMLLRYRGAVQAEFWRSLGALAALRGEGAGPAEVRSGPEPVLPETKRTRAA